ncbi:MAG: hypothetical protein WD851_18875 [Pirellulales bacterium]
MYRALAIKELRESAGLLALAVLAMGYALAMLTGISLLPGWNSRVGSLPFVSDSLPFYLSVIGGGFAILLGLKQTAWEGFRGTYQFLLHRPLARTRLFWSKLVVGLVLLQTAAALWILLYALWAATPGNHDAPFFWSMTLPTWRLWFSLPILYFGGFLSGLRPAHWFGTRFAPVLTAGLAVSLLQAPSWWWMWLPIWILVVAMELLAIFYFVRQRDY